MKLNQIDNGQGSREVTPTADAGLKVKSHVKAGLANVAFNNPTLLPVTALVVRPIAICG